MVIENIRECLLKRGIGAAELARGTGIDQTRLEDGLYNGEDLSTEECMLVCRFLNLPFSTFAERR